MPAVRSCGAWSRLVAGGVARSRSRIGRGFHPKKKRRG